MKTYLDKNGLLYLINLIQTDLDAKVEITDIVDNLTDTSTDKPLSANQGKVLSEKIGEYPTSGDIMLKSIFDTDSDGTIDEAAHATSADTATNATSANHAETATSATTADTATNATQLGGVAAEKYVQIGEDGFVPSDKLPSFVDDVIEGYYKKEDGQFYKEAGFENQITGETGKIYVDITVPTEPVSYRYGGSAYVAIVSSDLVAITNQEIETLWLAE